MHFDQAGIVTLGCNIHDEMMAYLVVTDAQYFGRTDGSGSWTADIRSRQVPRRRSGTRA